MLARSYWTEARQNKRCAIGARKASICACGLFCFLRGQELAATTVELVTTRKHPEGALRKQRLGIGECGSLYTNASA